MYAKSNFRGPAEVGRVEQGQYEDQGLVRAEGNAYALVVKK